MDTFTLPVQLRTELGKSVDKIRRQHQIPAVVYGHGQPSRPVTVDERQFQKIYRQAGSSSLVDLVIDGQTPIKALIQTLQRHPTKHAVTHIDFYQVNMTEKIATEIELRFVGESPAVKEQGGVLVRTMDNVKVECLPSDLVPAIDVDLSRLKNFEDRIHVSDIVVPAGITLREKAEEVVASVTPPRSEAEIEALSQKVEENVEGVEVAKKEKAEEETEVSAEESITPATK